MSGLKGKTILVTGATSGFGKATAELLARKGARLIVTGRRQDRLQALKAALGGAVHTLAFDMRDLPAMENAIASLPQEFQAIDVLVNNAGLALGLEMADAANLDDWVQMIETNNLGLVAMTRAILPGMKQRGGGHVVNISSTAGNYHYPGANVYGASKAFVTYFSLALRSDLAGTGIRVTNLEPGMADTEFSNVRFKGDDAKAADVYKGVEPLRAEDIAEAIRWAITQPAHVNINRIEMMATAQAPAGLMVYRKN